MSKTKVPIVAIVGRANVGKSSFFNAAIRKREAVTANEPGTTRDSIMAKASVFVPVASGLNAVQGSSEERASRTLATVSERESVADTAMRQKPAGVTGSARQQDKAARGYWKDFWLIDTAGVKDPQDEFEFTIQDQITQAADSADIIMMMIDGQAAVNDEDRRLAKLMLKTKKPVILIVNKIDRVKNPDPDQYRKLGIKDIFLTSVSQSRGLNEVLAHIAANLPKASIKVAKDRLRLAILGRPNAGKSALFNAMGKKQQAIVADRAGTTRDVNRVVIKYEKREIELLDTAGIRRSGKIKQGIEQFSVIRSLAAIEEADVCLLLMDVNELNVQLDQKIAGMIKEAGKGLILVVSKWDIAEGRDAFTRDVLAPQIAHDFAFVPWAPLVFTSSETGQNVTKIFELVLEIAENRKTKIRTAQLNKWLESVVAKHPPAGLKNRSPKLHYMVQEDDNPDPTFKIYGSDTKFLHWSYKRFMEKELRANFGFEGTPVKFWFFDRK